ncbi:hypothetical protein BASH2_04276 [Bacillus anthracis]|nr:hypothetical protein BASH2_04276 [Bacillus anthracis]
MNCKPNPFPVILGLIPRPISTVPSVILQTVK